MYKQLCFVVGKDGFGEVLFGFDRTDPTYFEDYGQEIQVLSTDLRKESSRRQFIEIEEIFPGLNLIYGW